MENSQTTATTPHSASVVPPSAAAATGVSLEGHPNVLADDHHNHRSSSSSNNSTSSNNNNSSCSGNTTPSGGRGAFLKSTSTSSASPSSNLVTTPSTRRTRHRVDAGEPRGCFNNYYSPRNIFQNSSSSPISSHSTSTAVTSSSPALGGSGLLGNSIPPPPTVIPVPQPPVVPGPEYYFQPMKMLSDFIGNSHSHFNSHNSQAASQLLLREMLQKKKIGYEEDVSEQISPVGMRESRELHRQLRSNSEESLGCSSGNNNNNNNNDSSPNNNNNNNNEEIKINGCKKRKLYQPQKSEFDDDPEDFKDVEDEVDMDYKNNISPDDDEEMMVKSPMAPLTRELLACERKQIPRSILQSWKENFKSTLMTHINELVDTQFNVLFGSIGSPPNGNPLPPHHHHPHSVASHPHRPASGNSRGGGLIGRQQSVTPPPAQTAPPPANSLPTSERGGNMGHSGQGDALVTKNHFNGGGSVLLNENDKLRMRFYRPPYSSALAGLAASNTRDPFDDDGPLSLVVTPKKKRHKVTDTRLTPRAVSRLLGNGSTPSDHYHMESAASPRSQLPSPPGSVPITLATSVAIPNPSLTESRHLFAPYAPLFNSVRSSLESPPTMIPHPMLNPVEYVQQLREISAAQQQAQREQQQREREPIHQATILERERGCSAGSADSQDTNGGSFEITPGMVYGTGHSSSTLTPMHLRKAKLMFFWVRYPSSSVLKMYFPDIKFNKNNTAQLVKWFSNFREFYYIQMEKYARQALSEGIKVAEDIHVSTENELYRVLNLHYNRNNHIEVPSNFRYVVEQTLREFFKAIQSGKDAEQSWKKAIYKVIARLDDPVPEYFKSPNFLEQLE